MPELLRVILNAAMQAERIEHLNAAPYQHTQERNGYANGFKPKTRQTRLVSIFPNQAACLRLVSAILNEISKEWLTGRTYLSLDVSAGF